VRIAITGANGFIGQALADRLCAGWRDASGRTPSEIVCVDTAIAPPRDPRCVAAAGDIADPAFLDDLTGSSFDVVFHLAAVPGGAAARDPDLGWRVNVEATAALLRRLSRQASPTRFVMASSIGVFGIPLPRHWVDDDTLPLPTMSYGGHKLIGETMVADHARRGLVDGLAVRLPGIVARPRVAGGHMSAFMSDILHALRAGEAYACPVPATATSWLMSRARCVDNLLHAAACPSPGQGERRAFNLPALRLSMADLVAGLSNRLGRDLAPLVTYGHDEMLVAQFGSYPEIATPIADRLGFLHDGDAGALVARALDLDPTDVSKGPA
jgi:nucleoside-diphosphate-sugar epimerase